MHEKQFMCLVIVHTCFHSSVTVYCFTRLCMSSCLDVVDDTFIKMNLLHSNVIDWNYKNKVIYYACFYKNKNDADFWSFS